MSIENAKLMEYGALFTITSSFQPYLAAHKKARMWLMVGLVVLFLLGILAFFLATL